MNLSVLVDSMARFFDWTTDVNVYVESVISMIFSDREAGAGKAKRPKF